MTADTRRLEEAEPQRHEPLRSGPPPPREDPERTVADVIAEVLEATPTAAEVGSSVLDAVGVAMYVTDREGRITFFNEAAVQLWGRRPSVGELWCGSLHLFHPDGTPMRHDECPMAIALQEARPVRDEEALLERPDGSRVWFRPYPTPIRDKQGQMTGAVNVLIDLTELRETEEALRSAAAELAASNAVKDEFLGLVSHELRTPITTVLGNAQLLHDKAAVIPEDVRAAMLGDIAAESERLLGIVENLLLLTRLDAGHHPDPEPQVLAHVVRTAVETFRRHHPNHEVDLSHEPRHLIVEADRPLLELLIDNLLSNAHKYSSEDEPIQVQVGLTDDEATVRVLDRGIGLEGVDADRLFTPFYRAPAAKATTSGIGIGLAACRRVADALGGRIWAGPREDGGAEFGFSLPRVGATGEQGITA
jgi:PAS domain S-box-containing protein